MSNLEWLEKWYLQNTDGEWEHFYGVSIGTLDNPGWFVHIDLRETKFENTKFDEIYQDRGENDWIRCVVEDEIFKGVGDSLKLNQIIEVFRNWVESSKLVIH